MWRPKAEQEAFLLAKAAFAKSHERAKVQQGGIDGVKSADGTLATNLTPPKE